MNLKKYNLQTNEMNSLQSQRFLTVYRFQWETQSIKYYAPAGVAAADLD